MTVYTKGTCIPKRSLLYFLEDFYGLGSVLPAARRLDFAPHSEVCTRACVTDSVAHPGRELPGEAIKR